MITCVRWFSLIVFLAWAQEAVAKDGSSHWYGSLYGGWASLDERGSAVENGPLAGLGLGRYLSASFSLSFEVERVFSEDNGVPEKNDSNFELNSTSLIARYYLSDEAQLLAPYLLAGIGVTNHSSYLSDSSNLSVSLGAGMRYGWNPQWSTYVQAMYRRDTDQIKALRQNGLNDVVFTAGLSYAFDW